MTTVSGVTDSYTEIATSWTGIQNIGHENIWVIISDTLPDDASQGFVLTPLDMAYPDTFGTGNVYARTKKSGKSSKIAIGA